MPCAALGSAADPDSRALTSPPTSSSTTRPTISPRKNHACGPIATQVSAVVLTSGAFVLNSATVRTCEEGGAWTSFRANWAPYNGVEYVYLVERTLAAAQNAAIRVSVQWLDPASPGNGKSTQRSGITKEIAVGYGEWAVLMTESRMDECPVAILVHVNDIKRSSPSE